MARVYILGRVRTQVHTVVWPQLQRTLPNTLLVVVVKRSSLDPAVRSAAYVRYDTKTKSSI